MAKDGYEAMMSRQDKVVSGFKNKKQVVMSQILPDILVAEQIKSIKNLRTMNSDLRLKKVKEHMNCKP